MEYIKINSGEKIQGQRQLLQSQIEILTILKRYQKYKKLRKKEIEMKTAFKRLVSEINQELNILEKHLPHVHKAYLIPYTKSTASSKRNSQIIKNSSLKESQEEIKRQNDLEIQIDEIKNKLASLGYE